MAVNEEVTMMMSVVPGATTGISTMMSGLVSINNVFLDMTRQLDASFGLIDTSIITTSTVVAQLGFKAAEAFGEFEQGMKIAQMVSNQTAQDMAYLKEQANELSVAYRTSIDEITEGLQTLGRAGLNSAAEQSEVLKNGLSTAKLESRELNGVLEELIQNTALLGGDLSSSNFGEQSQYINDLLVATSMTAPITTHDVSETLKYSGGIAAAAGANIESEEGKAILEDYMGAIAAFAQKGVTGSIAGTALRAFFNKPATQDSSVLEALESIHLKPEYLWEEGGDKMKPVSQQIAIIKNQMDELNVSTMDQLQIWSKIVGGKMGQQMMKLDSEQIKNLTSEIQVADGAQKKAAGTLQTFQSNIKEMTEQGQVAFRSFGENVAKFLNPIIDTLTKLLEFLSNPAASFTLFVGFISIIDLAANKIKNVFHKLKEEFGQVLEYIKMQEQLFAMRPSYERYHGKKLSDSELVEKHGTYNLGKAQLREHQLMLDEKFTSEQLGFIEASRKYTKKDIRDYINFSDENSAVPYYAWHPKIQEFYTGRDKKNAYDKLTPQLLVQLLADNDLLQDKWVNALYNTQTPLDFEKVMQDYGEEMVVALTNHFFSEKKGMGLTSRNKFTSIKAMIDALPGQTIYNPATDKEFRIDPASSKSDMSVEELIAKNNNADSGSSKFRVITPNDVANPELGDKIANEVIKGTKPGDPGDTLKDFDKVMEYWNEARRKKNKNNEEEILSILQNLGMDEEDDFGYKAAVSEGWINPEKVTREKYINDMRKVIELRENKIVQEVASSLIQNAEHMGLRPFHLALLTDDEAFSSVKSHRINQATRNQFSKALELIRQQVFGDEYSDDDILSMREIHEKELKDIADKRKEIKNEYNNHFRNNDTTSVNLNEIKTGAETISDQTLMLKKAILNRFLSGNEDFQKVTGFNFWEGDLLIPEEMLFSNTGIGKDDFKNLKTTLGKTVFELLEEQSKVTGDNTSDTLDWFFVLFEKELADKRSLIDDEIKKGSTNDAQTSKLDSSLWNKVRQSIDIDKVSEQLLKYQPEKIKMLAKSFGLPIEQLIKEAGTDILENGQVEDMIIDALQQENINLDLDYIHTLPNTDLKSLASILQYKGSKKNKNILKFLDNFGNSDVKGTDNEDISDNLPTSSVSKKDPAIVEELNAKLEQAEKDLEEAINHANEGLQSTVEHSEEFEEKCDEIKRKIAEIGEEANEVTNQLLEKNRKFVEENTPVTQEEIAKERAEVVKEKTEAAKEVEKERREKNHEMLLAARGMSPEQAKETSGTTNRVRKTLTDAAELNVHGMNTDVLKAVGAIEEQKEPGFLAGLKERLSSSIREGLEATLFKERPGRFIGSAQNKTLGQKAVNTVGNVIDMLGGSFMVAMELATVAINLWTEAFQGYCEELKKASEDLQKAYSNWNTAEDTLRNTYRNQNPDATPEELNQMVLDTYSTMNKDMAEAFNNGSEIWLKKINTQAAEQPKYEYDEELDDGTMKVVQEEIDQEQALEDAIKTNTGALYEATSELSMAMDKYVRKGTDSWWGIQGGTGQITDVLGKAQDFYDHIGWTNLLNPILMFNRGLEMLNLKSSDNRFESDHSKFTDNNEFLLTARQKDENYAGYTEMSGLMLQDFKDAGGDYLAGLQTMMGADALTMNNVMRQAGRDFLADQAKFASRLSQGDNLRLQTSMKQDPKTWKSLAKEVMKYEKKTGKAAKPTSTKKIEGLINKLNSSMGGGFHATQILQAAYFQVMQGMLETAKSVIVPILANNSQIAANTLFNAEGINQSGSGTATNTGNTVGINSAIAAMVAQIAMAKAAEATYNGILAQDPSKLSGGDLRAYQIAQESSDAQDFLKRASNASYQGAHLGINWDTIWQNGVNLFSQPAQQYQFKSPIEYYSARDNQNAMDKILTNFGMTGRMFTYGEDALTSQKIVEKAINDWREGGSSSQQIYESLSQIYQSDQFYDKMTDAYLSSGDDDDAGSGGGGGGSGSGDKDKDTGTKKERVDLVLCNKKEIPKLNVNLFKKAPSFTILNKNFKLRDIKVNTQDKPKAVLASIKNAIIDVQKRTDPKIIQDEQAEYDPVAATDGNQTPSGSTGTSTDE